MNSAPPGALFLRQHRTTGDNGPLSLSGRGLALFGPSLQLAHDRALFRARELRERDDDFGDLVGVCKQRSEWHTEHVRERLRRTQIALIDTTLVSIDACACHVNRYLGGNTQFFLSETGGQSSGTQAIGEDESSVFQGYGLCR